MLAETIVIAEEYMQLNDWEAVKRNLLLHNSLYKIKTATFNREFVEIKKRISTLTIQQLSILSNGDKEEARIMICLSLAKTYAIFYDFLVEVLRTKIVHYNNSLSDSDYNQFIQTKISSHPELEQISPITAKKVKQVIFKFLEQVGLIDKSKTRILKPFLNKDVIRVIIDDDPDWLACFLYSNEEIRTLRQTLNHA